MLQNPEWCIQKLSQYKTHIDKNPHGELECLGHIYKMAE